MIHTLIVIAKQPIAGRVKTRLVPPLTPSEAAYLAGAALSDTLQAVDATPSIAKLLAFDGDHTAWRPEGWAACSQPGGGLDRRLASAFRAAPQGAALLVGMDTPQLRPEQLTLFDPTAYDACLGPAADGGYWAIGFRHPSIARRAITGIAMSTDHTAEDQLRRLDKLGLRVQILDELVDVDTIADADLVAAQAPDTAFATAFAGLTFPIVQAG